MAHVTRHEIQTEPLLKLTDGALKWSCGRLRKIISRKRTIAALVELCEAGSQVGILFRLNLSQLNQHVPDIFYLVDFTGVIVINRKQVFCLHLPRDDLAIYLILFQL